MWEGGGDSEMTPSEVRTKDPDLRDIVEREGIDLQNILDQWKRQGMDTIPSDQLDHIQYLFLMREEAKARGIKCMHGEIGMTSKATKLKSLKLERISSSLTYTNSLI